MKKVLSFVLVLAMILGSVSLAFATGFSDTEGTDYDEAARLLSDLGVISGYADGTFKPENPVTRAEFAAMMVRALGFQVAGTSAVTAFSDVPASYWASTYIKYASELGIIYGYNDGTFRPKNNITNDEAIAMLIRALGYKAQYLQGTYPTSHINTALALGILDDIPTGSAPASRGTIAQLVFNALGEPTVKYDAAGNVFANGLSMLERLGGQLFNGGDPFVVTGTETAAKGVNLKQYLGAYVKAYADKNDEDKIIAVSKVLSEFVTNDATIADGEFAKFKKDDKIGDAKLRNNPVNTTESAMAWALFDNGEVIDTLPYTEDTDYTFAVKKDGNYIAKVYSVSKWTPTDMFMLDADMLEELKEDNTLNSHSFALDNKDNIDASSFGLFGVNSLDDLKEDYVVAVYVGGSGNITRVEVGTKTVDGTVTRISSKGAVTVAGEAYKVNKDFGEYTEPQIDDKGTFYLDYNGKIFALDGEAVAKSYGVLLATTDPADVDTKKQLPKGKSGFEALIFTADGKAVVYDINNKAKDANKDAIVTGGALTISSVRDDVSDDVLVQYGLNADGQVIFLQKLDTKTLDGDVSKKGTVVGQGHIFNEDTVIFTYEGPGVNDYALVKRSSVLGANDVKGSYAVKADNNKVVTVALLSDFKTVDDTYVVLNGVDEVTKGYELMGFDAKTGKAITYVSSEDVETTTAAVLYKLTFSGDKVTAADSGLTPDTTSVGGTKTTLVSGKNAWTFNNGSDHFTVSDDAQVFVKNADGDWTVKSISYLKGLKNKDVTLYDLDDDDTVAYEVVFVE